MSYFSVMKNVSGVFGQPTGIAAIASLGLHGAIAMIVPLIPVDPHPPSEVEPTRTVGVMELSPSDMGKFPQTDDTPQQVALQPETALPQSQIGLAQPQLPLQQQVPSGSSSYQPPESPPIQAPPSSQQSTLPTMNQVPGDVMSIPALPRGQKLHNFDRENFSTIPAIPPRNRSYPDMYSVPPGQNYQWGRPLNNNRLPENDLAHQQPSREPLNNPTSDRTDTGIPGVAEIPQGDIPAKQPSRDKVPESPQSKTATRGINGDQVATNSPLGETKPERNPTQTPQKLPDTSNPSDGQAKTTENSKSDLQSFASQREEVQQQYPNIQEHGVIRETIPTDEEALAGNVLGILIVATDGKVVDLKFQNKSTSPELKAKVKEFFKANPPKGTKQISSYPFDLRFSKNLSKSPTDEKPSNNSPSSATNPSVPPASIPANTSGNNQENIPANTSGNNQGNNPANTPGNNPANTPGNNQGNNPANTSGNNQGNNPANTPKNNQENIKTEKSLGTKLSSNTIVLSTESAQKLIQQLREKKQQRENSSVKA